MVLNMVYQSKVRTGPVLTGHMSSVFLNRTQQCLSIDGSVYMLSLGGLDSKSCEVFRTDSLLSPIVKLNKTANDLLAITIDNKVIHIDFARR